MSNPKTGIEESQAFSLENQILTLLDNFPAKTYLNHFSLLEKLAPKFVRMMKEENMSVEKFQTVFIKKFAPKIMSLESKFIRPVIKGEDYLEQIRETNYLVDLESAMKNTVAGFVTKEFFSDRVTWDPEIKKAPLEEKTSSAVDDTIKES